MAREPTQELNGLTPMVNIMQILLAKCQSAQAGLMGSCLTNIHMCMPCLTSTLVSHCVLWFQFYAEWCYFKEWVWN